MKMMNRHIWQCAAAVMVFGMVSAGVLGAEEDVEHFILPEAPPTIERVKEPPLDQPYLRKQNFMPEFDLSPAPVLVGLRFHKFLSDDDPVKIGLYQGSFASRGANFVYTSTKNVEASYAGNSTDGEYSNLAKDENIFDLRFKSEVLQDRYFYAGVKSDEASLFQQQKNFYGFNTGYDWYIRENLNAKAGVLYEKGEIKGQDINESVSGSLGLLWQPFEGQNLNLLLCPHKDTALGAIGGGTGEFDTGSLKYDVMIFPNVVLGGGARYTKDKIFPQAFFAAGFLPGFKLSVNYLPGIEQLSWNGLYAGDGHVEVNKNILYPDSVYDFTENVSYYLNENNSLEFELSQAQWNNYIFWQDVPGAGLITPENMNSFYAASGRVKAKLKQGPFTLNVSGEHNVDNSVAFMPDYRFSGVVEFTAGSWVFGAGYDYTGPARYSSLSNNQLAAYGNLSASVKKAIGREVELYMSCDNLQSEKIETQPGYVRDAPIFYAGINLRL